jgi:hypothetical protein
VNHVCKSSKVGPSENTRWISGSLCRWLGSGDGCLSSAESGDSIMAGKLAYLSQKSKLFVRSVWLRVVSAFLLRSWWVSESSLSSAQE